MAKPILLFALCFLLSYTTFAKIWRVNNNSGVTADFTTIQAAHDGATSGDTLHIESSPNNYGPLNSRKKLVIIGPGFFLDANADLQAFTQTAKISYVYYYSGSEGSVIMGMDFSGSYMQVYSSDIIIKRNKFSSSDGASIQDWSVGYIDVFYKETDSNIPANNIIITQNYGLRVTVSYASTGILISNNYLSTNAYEGDQSGSFSIRTTTSAVVLVQNNIFRRGRVLTYNSNVSNNIMYAGTFEGTGNLISNNIGSGTQFGTTNNNKSTIDMSTVFVATGSADGYWKLKPGSPAIGAGYGSTAQNPVDAGMFGGQTPYVLSGIPPVPSVYFFENQPVGSSSDPIDVTIKVRANN